MRVILFLLMILLISSCVTDPSKPIDTTPVEKLDNGVFVLYEGLFNYNNSGLLRFNPKNNELDPNFFKSANEGLNLGDTPSDILVKGDTAYITVLSTKSLLVLNTKSGKYLGQIKFQGNRFPRHLCLVNDSIIAMSDLYDNSISLINTKNSSLITDNIYSGPQPEFLTSDGKFIYVANSAYGDLNAKHPEAQTLSIIDIQTKKLIKRVKIGANLCEVILNKRNNKLYCGYYNLPSQRDSIGGIAELDLLTYKITRTWRTNIRSMNLSISNDSLIFINQLAAGNDKVVWKGVSYIDLNSKSDSVYKLIENPKNTDIWYTMSINPNDGSVWIANAKNQQTDGEVLIYKFDNLATPFYKFQVGINPNRIVFY